MRVSLDYRAALGGGQTGRKLSSLIAKTTFRRTYVGASKAARVSRSWYGHAHAGRRRARALGPTRPSRAEAFAHGPLGRRNFLGGVSPITCRCVSQTTAGFTPAAPCTCMNTVVVVRFRAGSVFRFAVGACASPAADVRFLTGSRIGFGRLGFAALGGVCACGCTSQDCASERPTIAETQPPNAARAR